MTRLIKSEDLAGLISVEDAIAAVRAGPSRAPNSSAA